MTIAVCPFEAGDGAAFNGAGSAQAGGSAFRLRREPASPTSLVIGSRLRPAMVVARFETES